MTIVQVKDLDRNDLDLLGDNVQRAIKIDHDRAAIDRSLACHEEADQSRPRSVTQPSILARGSR